MKVVGSICKVIAIINRLTFLVSLYLVSGVHKNHSDL